MGTFDMEFTNYRIKNRRPWQIYIIVPIANIHNCAFIVIVLFYWHLFYSNVCQLFNILCTIYFIYCIYLWFYAYVLCQKWRNKDVQSVIQNTIRVWPTYGAIFVTQRCHVYIVWVWSYYADINSTNEGPKFCDRTAKVMITSSNGNIFRVTGLLCGEFTGPRWIPRTKASDAEL